MKSKKECLICQKQFCYDINEKNNFKIYQKVRDHCHYTGKFRGAAHSICNLNYEVSQEILVRTHNDSTYDYHFLIKKLAEEFKGQFECLVQNTVKEITFSAPIKKEHDNDKRITYKIKFIIVEDSCKVNYQKLLITYLKLTTKIAKHAQRENISNESASLLGLKIIDLITDTKNAREHLPSQ